MQVRREAQIYIIMFSPVVSTGNSAYAIIFATSAYIETIAIQTNNVANPGVIFKTLVQIHPLLLSKVKNVDPYILYLDKMLNCSSEIMLVSDKGCSRALD